MCGDINVDYLTNCYQKQQLSLLLGTYRIFYMVDFPTRIQNNHASVTDNIFLDLSTLHAHMILPLSCGLSDDDAHCVISKNSLVRPIINDKFKNKFKPSLVTNDTISYFQELLSKETWDNIYLNSYINNIFNDFLIMFLNIFGAGFPVIYICNGMARGLLPKALKRPCQHSQSLLFN
jgi:hypothetical protein